MRLVIEAREFATLSRETQDELLGRFAGAAWLQKSPSHQPPVQEDDLVDLMPTQAARLTEMLSNEQRYLLQLFAQRGGRVELNELLAAISHADSEAASRFLSVISEKVASLVADNANGKSLFAREQASGEEPTVYRLSARTTQSLRCLFPVT